MKAFLALRKFGNVSFRGKFLIIWNVEVSSFEFGVWEIIILVLQLNVAEIGGLQGLFPFLYFHFNP